MLSSVLPWEWILENVLDLKEFSLPCLKELISYIPHIEDARCSKLLQKVALRYLEEIVLTRKLDPCSIALIKYILKAQGGSNLRRIHSLKESAENDLILRVETEVVLATIRHQGRSGGRNWEAFEDAVEELFPESIKETCKAERRKEFMSLLLVDEHQDDFCEQVLRKYQLEALLKDLLIFIDSQKSLLKTKFLDQLAKDVRSGSYIPSSPSRPCEERLSTPTGVTKDSDGNRELPGMFFSRAKKVLPNSSETEPSLPTILLGEPIERSAKATKTHVHISGSSSFFPVSFVDGGQTKSLEVEELRDRNLAGKKTTGIGKVPVQEDLRVDTSASMMEVENVARELTSQMNEFVNSMDKFAADIHKVAVNSTEQAYALVNTVVSQEKQRVDPLSFLANFDLPVKRSAAEQLPESATKSKRDCLDDSPGRQTDIDGGSLAGINVRKDGSRGHFVREDEGDVELDCSVAGDGAHLLNEPSLYKRVKAFLGQFTHEQRVPRHGTSSVPGLKCVARGDDKRCSLCQKGGVLLSCHGCSVIVHERCLQELDMGKEVSEPHWFCPSCVEELTLEVLERVKAEADTARKKAAAFVFARTKQSTERRSSVDQMTTGAASGTHENRKRKDGKEQSQGPKRGPKSSSLDGKETSQAREVKVREGCSSPPTSEQFDKRYFLRPRICPDSRKESQSDFIVEEVEDLAWSKPNKTVADGPERVSVPSLTTADSSGNESISKMATPATVQTSPADEEIPETRIPSRECVENNVQTDVKARECFDEGKEATSAESSGAKQNIPGNGNLTPAKDQQVSTSKAVVDEGDGHDGDLEEDRHQSGAECSKDDQTSDHLSPVDERTPPRRGRYRSRKKIPGIRRRNLPWSESEVAVLREGVKNFSNSGWGFQWKNILEFGYGKFDPTRTAVDLKDKWRNLNRFQDKSSGSDASS